MTLKGVDMNQLKDRKQLLTSFDTFRRDYDLSGTMKGLDAFNQRALEVLSSSTLADALDLTKEPQTIRDLYGKGSPKITATGRPATSSIS